MMPLLLKHLATSLTRQLSNVGRLNQGFPSAAAGAYRCLCTFTTAPRTLLLSSIRIIQPSSSGSFAPFGPSLFGECRHLPWFQPSAGMKTKSALKRRCKDCFIVRRRGRLFVFCKTNPRHKQKQG